MHSLHALWVPLQQKEPDPQAYKQIVGAELPITVSGF